jgi:thioredoxin-like negative regulator of GroEL
MSVDVYSTSQDELNDERMLEQYRQQRLDQLRQERLMNRFGDLHEIKKADWISEVTEGSKSAPVVVHLYSDAKAECELLNEILEHVARKFKYVKFLKIRSTQGAFM